MQAGAFKRCLPVSLQSGDEGVEGEVGGGHFVALSGSRPSFIGEQTLRSHVGQIVRYKPPMLVVSRGRASACSNSYLVPQQSHVAVWIRNFGATPRTFTTII